MIIINSNLCVCRDCTNSCTKDPFFCNEHNHFTNEEKRTIVTSRIKSDIELIIRKRTQLKDFKIPMFHHSKQQSYTEVSRQ